MSSWRNFAAIGCWLLPAAFGVLMLASAAVIVMSASGDHFHLGESVVATTAALLVATFVLTISLQGIRREIPGILQDRFPYDPQRWRRQWRNLHRIPESNGGFVLVVIWLFAAEALVVAPRVIVWLLARERRAVGTAAVAFVIALTAAGVLVGCSLAGAADVPFAFDLPDGDCWTDYTEFNREVVWKLRVRAESSPYTAEFDLLVMP